MKKIKNSKRHVRRPQVKTNSKNKLLLELKILRMIFSKIDKPKNYPKKHPKPQIKKKLKIM